jgi:hypothetical protein
MCAPRAKEATAQTRELRLSRLVSLVPSLSDLAFLIPILVLFWCTTGVGWLLTDSDTGWHIRAGEWMLKNARVPSADLFSFTKAGQPWFAWEWLSDVLMAAMHSRFGLGGIVVASLVLLGATSVCIYRSTVEESEYRLIAILLTGLAMAASTIHWLARPHLVTPLFAAVFCRVLNRVEKRASDDRLFLQLPTLMVVWVNIHGGFFVGIALLMTYALGTAVEALVHGSLDGTWLRARKYLLSAIACVVASLANPYGYRLHIHVLQYLGSSFYFKRISEFQSADFHKFTVSYFETLLVLAIAAAAWHLGKERFIQALLLLSWSHLALFSVRNIPIFAVVSSPGIGLAMRDWLKLADTRWLLGWRGRLAANVAELEAGVQLIASHQRRRRWHLAPCLVVLALALSVSHLGRVKSLHAEFDGKRFPTDAATFLSLNDPLPSLRVYASWQWGGYLIYRLWPSVHVFDDGRTDFYGPRFVEEGLRAWDARPDWAEIFAQYSVNAALVPVDSALATVLRQRVDWKLVYSDRVAVMFAKIDEANQKLISHERSVELSVKRAEPRKGTGAFRIVLKHHPHAVGARPGASSETTYGLCSAPLSMWGRARASELRMIAPPEKYAVRKLPKSIENSKSFIKSIRRSRMS